MYLLLVVFATEAQHVCPTLDMRKSTMESSNHAHSQHHHFEPYFPLKNFTRSYVRPKNGSTAEANGGTRVKIRRGERVVNCAGLSFEMLGIIETPVRRLPGRQDM